MNFFKSNNKHRLLIYPFAILIFLIGLYFFYQSNFFAYRLLRAIICFGYLGLLFLFFKNSISKLFTIFLLLYGLSSLASIWYESNEIAILSTGLNFLSFLVVLVALFPKISFKKIKGFFLVAFIIMMIVNGFLMYQLIDMIREFTLSNFHFTIIICSTISLLFVSFLAFLYNDQYSTKATFVFLFVVIVILFSEIFRAFAYYNIAFGNIDVHISRLLLLISMCLLIEYNFINKKEEEILYIQKKKINPN